MLDRHGNKTWEGEIVLNRHGGQYGLCARRSKESGEDNWKVANVMLQAEAGVFE